MQATPAADTTYLVVLRRLISLSRCSGELSQFLLGSGVPADQENDDRGQQDSRNASAQNETKYDVAVIWQLQADRVLKREKYST